MFLCKQTVNRGMDHIWLLELPGCIHGCTTLSDQKIHGGGNDTWDERQSCDHCNNTMLLQVNDHGNRQMSKVSCCPNSQLVCYDLTTSFWSHLAPGICIGWNILCWLSHIVIVTKLLTQQAGCVSQRHLRWPPNHCHNDIFEVLHDKSHPVPARQQHGLSLHDLLVLFVKGCHVKRHLAF